MSFFILQQPATCTTSIRVFGKAVSRSSRSDCGCRRSSGEFLVMLVRGCIGRRGWLFSRAERTYATERPTGASEVDAANALVAVRSFRDQLAERRIRLVVVPVPNKEKRRSREGSPGGWKGRE